MSKKYTFMFFSADRLGKVRTWSLSQGAIVFLCAFVFIAVCALGVSIYTIKSMYSAKKQLLAEYEANNNYKKQFELLTAQIESISSKITEIDNLEYKIRDLVTLQKGNVPLKPIAVGGREVDLLRQYSASAAVNEKYYFEALDTTLNSLSYEIDQREATLSSLVALLEEKRLTMNFTPTIMPVKGWVSSSFGYRLSPFTNRQTFHDGVDIAAKNGTNVIASGAGVVVFAGVKSGFGNMVVIDHGYGYITKYGHNDELMVKVGDKVSKGQPIARVGSSGLSTGPHLHYEVLVNGIPVDPLKFIIDERS